MEWRDDVILLASRPLGEGTALIDVFSGLHGRYGGALRGGASRKMAPLLQPGAQLDATWRARLDSQLGSFTVEPLRGRAGALLADRLALLGLGAVCALTRYALPERQPYPELYRHTLALLDRLGQPGWLQDYALWELTLLEETGYGLDLHKCAVTGAIEGLAYVSPRSGRAVTKDGAGDYAARLLPLPGGLHAGGTLDADGLRAALALSGHFLADWLARAMDKPLPEARARLVRAVT
ncbi:MAG: DNA repair protein RecO [Alphaproteobacteria bacterium]|jgi:DNA repair protein RecO (recombination protein O)|nr:DNA repair protein RecO [Alphaproteobacteria bacterium]